MDKAQILAAISPRLWKTADLDRSDAVRTAHLLEALKAADIGDADNLSSPAPDGELDMQYELDMVATLLSKSAYAEQIISEMNALSAPWDANKSRNSRPTQSLVAEKLR